MDIQTRRDGHTNQLLAKGWTYKPEGMDIKPEGMGYILLETWQGRACELSTLALDICIISFLFIMSRCVQAYSYVSMHGRGECTQSERNKLCDKAIRNLPRRQPSLYIGRHLCQTKNTSARDGSRSQSTGSYRAVNDSV